VVEKAFLDTFETADVKDGPGWQKVKDGDLATHKYLGEVARLLRPGASRAFNYIEIHWNTLGLPKAVSKVINCSYTYVGGPSDPKVQTAAPLDIPGRTTTSIL
jgi:hypothetical protein